DSRIERQLYFVLERFYIRFHDLFTEHFNPSTINEKGKKAQAQLEINRNQLLDHVGYELLQEVRAVSLRIEAYIQELFQEVNRYMQEEVYTISEMLHFPSIEKIDFTTPQYKEAFEHMDVEQFQKALK